MHAPLPWGWTAHRHPDTMETYYHHRPTQTSHYQHPIDSICREELRALTSVMSTQRDGAAKLASLRAEMEAWCVLLSSLRAAAAAAARTRTRTRPPPPPPSAVAHSCSCPLDAPLTCCLGGPYEYHRVHAPDDICPRACLRQP
jgi:hypothetical protein